jgi:hypothetical protein
MRIARLERQGGINDPYVRVTRRTNAHNVAFELTRKLNDRGIGYIEDDSLYLEKIMRYPRILHKAMIDVEETRAGLLGRAGERDQFGEILYGELEEMVARSALERLKKLKSSKLFVKRVVSPRTGKNGWIVILKSQRL